MAGLTGAGVMGVVAAVMSRRWEWGVSDCCAAACDVFAALHGVDPMARLRGAYASRAEAEAMIESAGGLHALAEGLAAEARLTRVDEPRPGDIGVGGREVAVGRCLMIRLDRGWAAKTPGGFAVVLRAEAAWRA